MLQDYLRSFRFNYIECNNRVGFGWRRVCDSFYRDDKRTITILQRNYVMFIIHFILQRWSTNRIDMVEGKGIIIGGSN